MYVGELRLFPYNFVPMGWAACDGQLLSVAEYGALFGILGTTYGGNGHTSFAVPDMRGRAPRHTSSELSLGERGGAATHTLTAAQLPPHAHQLPVSTATATSRSPGGRFPAVGRHENYAAPGGGTVPMQAGRVVPAGNGLPHDNVQPYLTMTWAIALEGQWPSEMDWDDPFLGEIKVFAGNFVPRHWLRCNGALLPVQGNTALYSLLGTMYGGNGTTTFALPNLQGRIAVHHDHWQGQSIGRMGGTETVSLLSGHMPSHTHPLLAAAGNATDTSPAGNLPAHARRELYAPAAGAESVASHGAGSSQGHDNMAPSIALNYLIATQGIFPSRW